VAAINSIQDFGHCSPPQRLPYRRNPGHADTLAKE
jgi:hypothetical protein